ncbi:MAG: hypothetical protein ABII12_04190, partial [Planctomycetota bacterium]
MWYIVIRLVLVGGMIATFFCCSCRSEKEEPKKEQPAASPTDNDAGAEAPPEPKTSMGIPSSPQQGESPLEYSKRYLKSADEYVKMWSEASYVRLSSEDVCRSLIRGLPLTTQVTLPPDQRSALIDAITDIVAMESSLGYEGYVRYAGRCRAKLNDETMQFLRESQEAAVGSPLSDEDVLRRVWDNLIFENGEGPWRGLCPKHSAILVRELKGEYETLQEEVYREGSPSTGYSYSSLKHEYPRTAEAQLVEDGSMTIATVRLLLQGRDPDTFAPTLLRFRWEPTL